MAANTPRLGDLPEPFPRVLGVRDYTWTRKVSTVAESQSFRLIKIVKDESVRYAVLTYDKEHESWVSGGEMDRDSTIAALCGAALALTNMPG